MSTTTQPVSADDRRKMPKDGFRCELVRKQIRTMSLAGSEHGVTIVRVARLLANYVEQCPRLYLLVVLLLLSGTLARNSAAAETGDAGYGRIVVPFLRTHCLRCHGPDVQEAEFRVDLQLPNDFLDRAGKEKWGEVVNVLNSHEMPPEDEPQPDAATVAHVVDWITQQTARAELQRRDSAIVLRRLNRDEYRNTIRDLVGIDFDPAMFPQDPPAGGFDNNGGALTISPLHIELYFDAARQILDRALVEGDRPPVLKWRFEPESGDSDSNRVTYDGQRLIVNGGQNRVENQFVVLHQSAWNKKINVRDFRLPFEGEYIVRVRAAGTVPTLDEVVESARQKLNGRLQERMAKEPQRAEWHQREFDETLNHFRTDRMYKFGPPRIKLTQDLGGQPRVVGEFDVAAPRDTPQVYEFPVRFTTESAGLTLENVYSIPSVLENFWFQTADDFARPEAWVDWLEIEGPVYPSWPPASHRMILSDSPLRERDERAYAREVIARFMRLAYRRPVTDAEVDAKLALFDKVRGDAPSFVEAIKTPLIGILVSPHFLYLAEPPAGDPLADSKPAPDETLSDNKSAALREFEDRTGRKIKARVLQVAGDNVKIEREDGKPFLVPIATFSDADQDYIRDHRFSLHENGARDVRGANSDYLNDYQLAIRLTYFLWSSMPDDELSQLADAGGLRDEQVLVAQVNRLLTDPKSEAFVRNFAGQWLGLREVGANPPAPDLYPRYDRHLETSIVQESQAFFAEILRHDLSVMNFVKSDFVVINERLARFYDIPDVRGDHFRRVAVPDGVPRGGVVTQASVLSITSNGTRTSPVKRGTWIMKNVLGIDPGLPVANAGEIAPKVPGIDKATVRQRLEIHRELAQCARCHNKIDPLGFALENFNAAGEWRDQEGFGYKGRVGANDPVIDASAKLLDGTEFVGVAGLQEVLVDKEELFLRCLAGKMFTYALGRELGVADKLHVDAAVEHMQQGDRTLRQLIQFVVRSEPFQTK